MASLDQMRRWFAEELEAVADVKTRALVEAFATVPREAYLGPGPWSILSRPRPGDGQLSYRTTPDDDPRHLYHNVLIAIDRGRGLNNGEPGALAAWLDALELRPADRVVHVGCGVGYYTAIIASVVGPDGSVLAIEYDAELAARSTANLASLPSVTVVHGDGTRLDPGEFDAAFINAGVTKLPRLWLDRMRDGARLLVPFTTEGDERPGWMILIRRQGERFSARLRGWVGIFPCEGARDAASQEQLRQAFDKPTWRDLRSLRRDAHASEPSCLLHHEDGFCLSTLS